MEIEKQLKHNTCPSGNCPEGLDSVRKVGLTPREKRAIFFTLKEHIFQLKKQRHALLGHS